MKRLVVFISVCCWVLLMHVLALLNLYFSSLNLYFSQLNLTFRRIILFPFFFQYFRFVP